MTVPGVGGELVWKQSVDSGCGGQGGMDWTLEGSRGPEYIVSEPKTHGGPHDRPHDQTHASLLLKWRPHGENHHGSVHGVSHDETHVGMLLKWRPHARTHAKWRFFDPESAEAYKEAWKSPWK